MTSDGSSSSRTSSAWRSEAALAAALVVGSGLVYSYRSYVGDERRIILALAAAGFVFAPLSARGLRLWLWFPALAIASWGGRLAASGWGGLGWWLACSVLGAVLAVRAGGRAAHYFLPETEDAVGVALQRGIRRNLQVAFVLFAGAFVWDGLGRPNPYARALLLVLSAVWFLRYLLLQSKHLGLLKERLLTAGLVPAQRWPLLVVMLVIGATRLPDELLPGGDAGPLLITSILLLVLAGLVLVLALVRLEWPRPLIRKTSFLAGMGLAVALAAVLVELEAWGPSRFTAFATLCTFVLVVVPFAHSNTKLLDRYPNASFLVPSPILAVMMAPVTAINGFRWQLASTGFLFAFACVMLVYQLVVVRRERYEGSVYVVAMLVTLGAIFFSNGAAWAESGSGWKIFLIALGFVLFAVDVLDRATNVAKRREA